MSKNAIRDWWHLYYRVEFIIDLVSLFEATKIKYFFNNDHGRSINLQRTDGFKNEKVRQHLAGSIFAALGIIFLNIDMTPTEDHMYHGNHMGHDLTGHDVTLLGIWKMTWMWFTMALVHVFLNDWGCKHCELS